MAVYTFRVSWEDDETVYRDIAVRSTQKFTHLQDAILQAYKFDNKKLASFYMSNDNWHKGKEITSDASKKNVIQIKDAVLRNFIEDPHQKIYFLYDFKEKWTFLIELLKINTTIDEKLSYPVCIKKAGTGPRQYPLSKEKKAGMATNGEESVEEEKFHEETFLYEEEEMEKDAEALEEGFETSGDTSEEQQPDEFSSEFDEK